MLTDWSTTDYGCSSAFAQLVEEETLFILVSTPDIHRTTGMALKFYNVKEKEPPLMEKAEKAEKAERESDRNRM